MWENPRPLVVVRICAVTTSRMVRRYGAIRGETRSVLIASAETEDFGRLRLRGLFVTSDKLLVSILLIYKHLMCVIFR